MLWIVPASVAMGVSTTMTLMAIPKYHLMFEIGDIVGTILGIVGIVIWLVIAYFQVKQDLAHPCTSSSSQDVKNSFWCWHAFSSYYL